MPPGLRDSAALPVWARDSRRGALLGLLLGGALAGVSVAAGFPDWADATWGLCLVAALVVVPAALLWRAGLVLALRHLNGGRPRETPLVEPVDGLAPLRGLDVAGAALVVVVLVLALVWGLGEDQVLPSF